MPLQTSGQISLNDIHVEVGGTSGTEVSINDADVRGLIAAASGAQMSFSDWYGKSNVDVSVGAMDWTNINITTLSPTASSNVQTVSGINTAITIRWGIALGSSINANRRFYIYKNGTVVNSGGNPAGGDVDISVVAGDTLSYSTYNIVTGTSADFLWVVTNLSDGGAQIDIGNAYHYKTALHGGGGAPPP